MRNISLLLTWYLRSHIPNATKEKLFSLVEKLCKTWDKDFEYRTAMNPGVPTFFYALNCCLLHHMFSLCNAPFTKATRHFLCCFERGICGSNLSNHLPGFYHEFQLVCPLRYKRFTSLASWPPCLAIILNYLFDFRADWSPEMLFPLKQVISSLRYLIIIEFFHSEKSP